jgi:hypothetical protein
VDIGVKDATDSLSITDDLELIKANVENIVGEFGEYIQESDSVDYEVNSFEDFIKYASTATLRKYLDDYYFNLTEKGLVDPRVYEDP